MNKMVKITKKIRREQAYLKDMPLKACDKCGEVLRQVTYYNTAKRTFTSQWVHTIKIDGVIFRLSNGSCKDGRLEGTTW